MNIEKLPTVSSFHKMLLKSACDYFSDQNIRSPWRTDYVVLRGSGRASKRYLDTIFIPNFNDKDDFEYYTPFNCNAYASDAIKIITGSYQYRLAKRLGMVFGQQMERVFFTDDKLGFATSDLDEQFLRGINLLAHPIQKIIHPTTPISNVSKASILIDPAAHSLLKHNFNIRHANFKLYVVDLSFLI
jgi:hypothetical protein